MAYEVKIYCTECDEEVPTYISSGFPIPTVCYECSKTIKQERKVAWLEAQRLKHTEIRLRELEEFMWEYQNGGPAALWPEPTRF